MKGSQADKLIIGSSFFNQVDLGLFLLRNKLSYSEKGRNSSVGYRVVRRCSGEI